MKAAGERILTQAETVGLEAAVVVDAVVVVVVVLGRHPMSRFALVVQGTGKTAEQ
jgi:hypothetical protein